MQIAVFGSSFRFVCLNFFLFFDFSLFHLRALNMEIHTIGNNVKMKPLFVNFFLVRKEAEKEQEKKNFQTKKKFSFIFHHHLFFFCVCWFVFFCACSTRRTYDWDWLLFHRIHFRTEFIFHTRTQSTLACDWPRKINQTRSNAHRIQYRYAARVQSK